jgi:hypothetical protein
MGFMRAYLLFFALLMTSCYQSNKFESGAIVVVDRPLNLSVDQPLISSTPEKASELLKRLQAYEYSKWVNSVQKIRNAYTNVMKLLEDKESIQFSVAFFKVLSISEDFEQRVFDLSQGSDELPNIEVLKFLYKSEKELNEMISVLTSFANSANDRIKYCALEAERYFQCQRDFFIALRNVDYRKLESNDDPFAIPPEVLRANARMLEQRDQMSETVIAFYNSFEN